ncbi:MAG TPA: rhomboid family intramembrane serine protease, partial [Myxococcota bacterium]|nr:rhomboid family intramembrane serine protease [Myxococcota bacterium]
VRMGANVSARVKEGEYYRLFTCVFLHAGFLHVFFNTYVLFALGGFFNRILGEARYLTIFLFSGVVGSLASVWLGKATVSVGASGAIWGLFGASLTLALFKTTFLPEAIRLRLRRVTIINLIINLGISFLPMIDFWAHLGGGIAGFLISLIFIVRPQSPVVHRWVGLGSRVLASILSLVYAAAIIYDFYVFTPWINQLAGPTKTIELAHVPFTVEMPASLVEEAPATNTVKSAYFSFGHPQIDQVVVELHFIHESLVGKKADREWLLRQREELLKEPKLTPEVKKSIYYRDSIHGGTLYYAQPIKNGQLIIHNYFITKDEYVIKISLLASETIKQSEADKLANQIMESIHHRSI